ncbi:hypothetical protein M407DRAFT_69939 [Tulasnella calospora MUT 4182]|uniref:T6SS Phospholipase effector Tle1-like catalytic domain-containing protein n=1 Tax=Tulasnella calospora MUT 4182 TaxID=1051891 RepID=A0A0C3QQH7_9AGAM|nr:hypothetical protein M407DRAFT_69939 [Tulasnella calospora MUT 4182]
MAYLTTDRVPRTLILCFDGTSDAFDDDVTNVVRLFSAFEKEDPHRQLCYYQPGIGTYLGPNRPWSSTLQRIVKVVDQAFAWYYVTHQRISDRYAGHVFSSLPKQVMSGYRFLMQTYIKGDRICMFGFSRGAYTARCLAGMLNKVGLLPRYNEEHISFAYAKYSDTSAGNEERAKGFKDSFSIHVDIAFVGVWDTVASCGLFGRHLPFTASNHIIRVFRHALALDERRSKFKPNPWHRNAHSPQAAANDPNQGTPVVHPLNNGPHRKETANDFIHFAVQELKRKRNKETVWSDDREAYDLALTNMECDIREVWFPGCHADVGGGSVKNGTEHCLANASLVWMVNHVISADVGVIFKRRASGRPLNDNDPRTLSWLTQANEVADANSDMVDQLSQRKFWWFLEIIPLWQHYQDRNAYWHKGFRLNRGRARDVLDPKPLFHSSVKLREGYIPKARVRESEPTYVDF